MGGAAVIVSVEIRVHHRSQYFAYTTGVSCCRTIGFLLLRQYNKFRSEVVRFIFLRTVTIKHCPYHNNYNLGFSLPLTTLAPVFRSNKCISISLSGLVIFEVISRYPDRAGMYMYKRRAARRC